MGTQEQNSLDKLYEYVEGKGMEVQLPRYRRSGNNPWYFRVEVLKDGKCLDYEVVKKSENILQAATRIHKRMVKDGML